MEKILKICHEWVLRWRVARVSGGSAVDWRRMLTTVRAFSYLRISPVLYSASPGVGSLEYSVDYVLLMPNHCFNNWNLFALRDCGSDEKSLDLAVRWDYSLDMALGSH